MPITINRVLNYNEQKVQQGKAICIGEGNMLLPANCMNFYQKLDVFESRNALSDATTKTIHISLNFDPSEKHSIEKLDRIASEYMQRIGFGEQPYLIYQHNDAAHPHIHIVSTTIREDGSRINTHNIGKNRSEPARKELEDLFVLVPAVKQEKIQEYALRPIEIEKAQYGYSETRRSITNIVSQVIEGYNFTSLPLFNAVLRQYNVIADEGKEDGIIRRNKGLQYRILDGQGNRIGVPIKASSLPGQPTIANLDKKYKTNLKRRDVPKQALKNTLDSLLEKKPSTLKQLLEELAVQKIQTVLRTNPEGRTYGITFVDQQNKAVFNGSELGKAYSIAGLQKHFEKSPSSDSSRELLQSQDLKLHTGFHSDLLDALIKPEKQEEQTPYHLRKKRRPDGNH